MLQLIRNWVTGWLAVVIVVMLVIPFAFWGINYYFGQGGDIVAAEVNGSKILLRDYQLTYQRIRQQYESRGGNIANKENKLKKQAIDTLVNRELLSQLKKDMNLTVSDDQVRQAIMSISAFRGEDGFDSSLYKRYLATAGYTPASFEAQVREDMTSQQLQAGIIESSFVTEAAAERVAKLNEQTRDLAYTFVPFKDAVKNIQVTDQEVKQYYEQHGQEFMEPEKVRIAYIDLSREELAKKVPVTEDALKSFYQNHKGNYTVAEQRKVDQVLVSAGKNPSDGALDKAKARAEEIKKQLESGKSFKDLSKEKLKKEPGVSVDFSQFGYLAKGVLDPKVDKAVFSMNKGEVGGPIRTDSGFHVVIVEDIKGGQASSLEQVRDQVEKDYRTDQAEKKFYDLADKLANSAFEQPDSLEPAAKEVGLPVQKSDYFSRDGTGKGLLGNSKVLEAAFSDDVLKNGNNSNVIELNENRDLVLRDIDHHPSRKKPLDQVRADIVKKIRFQKGSSRTREIGQDIIAGLKQGDSEESLARKYAVDWKTASDVKRKDERVNREVLRTAFSLGQSKSGKPAIGGTAMGTGDYAVVVVKAVNNVGTVAYEDVHPVRQKMERIQAGKSWMSFMDGLKENAKIHVYKSNL
ncbi:MAG: SurA N-terminal domain-containing protein [Gammaproteobacteria bacterium]